ncbi:MAG: hydroxyacid dehydrogenase [Clostridia bacterium]|nr:hydroxyacid dehydrogenase [Clostridia bacterium]
MKIAFLDAATLGDDLSYERFAQFGEVAVHQSTATEEFEAHIGDAEVAIVNKFKLNAENLPMAKKLRLICVAATGYDNIDLEYCRGQGIAVCNVVGYSTQCVAQVTVSMALSLYTHLSEYTEFVRNGEYTKRGIANCLFPVYHEIAGKTWGIVGFGNIGQQVGRVAQALGCRILVHKRTPMDGWDCVDLDTVCREADILSLHVPLNDATRGMLDERHIAMMKSDAIVINVARGAVTDEHALAQAISENRLGGLGIDVYSAEPMSKDHPFQLLKELPNVCLTPHMAWGGYETRVRLLNEMAENIQAFLEGAKRCRVD